MPDWTAARRSTKSARRPGLELIPSHRGDRFQHAEEEASCREKFSGYLRKPFSPARTVRRTRRSFFRAEQNETANRSETTARTRTRRRDDLVPGTGLPQTVAPLEAQEWPGLRDSLAINETREFAHRLEGLGRATQLRTGAQPMRRL